MFFSDIVPTIHHYVSLIARCVSKKHLKLGMTVHSHLIKTALASDSFLVNHLIGMYSRCSSIRSAHKAFDDLDTKNSYSWNTIISAYARIGDFKKALDLFDEMPQRALVSYNSLISGLSRHGFYVESLSVFMHVQKEYDCLSMDEFTFVGVVGACAHLGAFKFLRQVHGVAIVMGLEFAKITYNSLIDAYGKCGGVDICRVLFDVMPEKDVVSWTSMVVAYMRAHNLDDACAIFNSMPVKNTVSWTALISGLVQNGRGDEALDLFVQMHGEGIQPSPHTFVSVLCACADRALAERGKQIHGCIVRTCFNGDLENIFIWNALIDMYCKCGDMRSAKILFLRMPNRDIVSWNSMITGFAQNGLGHESLVFLRTMLETNVRPNHVTFLGALSACSHTGLDIEALQIFNAMEKDYSLQPRFDHYAILVDLLGRKNRLEEAMELIESVSNKSNHVGMWGALLGACKVHGNLAIARKAVDALLNLEPQNAARYVMISSIYAATNRWDDSCRVRKQMEERALTKDVANSWIEVKNEMHKFPAKDQFQYQMGDLYEVLGKLAYHMKEAGYVPEPNLTLILENDDDDDGG
ncbi:hypothetical protein EUGRSUZ_J01338 [Eucalyptus grandis]|uniref:Uncharacterized protein n=2 Tax=Eucalyptus grandis TaxID=71139 RepID=A0A059ACR5_EUCGR|nr:hypothetical protein EUGRSUZ_J01338 [Eucalyptus grandis]